MQNEQQPWEQFLEHGPTGWSAESGLLGAAIGSLHLCVSGLGASSKISIWGSTMGGISGVPPGFIAGFVWGSNGTSWDGGWPNCNRFLRPFPAPFQRSTGSAQRTDSQSEPACNCPSGFTSIFLSGDANNCSSGNAGNRSSGSAWNCSSRRAKTVCSSKKHIRISNVTKFLLLIPMI